MARRRGKPGARELRHTILCDWCGERKETSRPDTKTCSPRCRQRLSTYTRSCGYPPDCAPGLVTAQEAIDIEILRLLVGERRRREEVKAERRAYQNSPLGRKLSGAEAPRLH